MKLRVHKVSTVLRKQLSVWSAPALDKSFYRFVTIHACEGQTDRRTEFSSLYRVCITCSAVKNDHLFLHRPSAVTHVHVRYMPLPVRLSTVCLSVVTFVRSTQAIEILGNVTTPFGTLAICDLSVKISRRCLRGTPPWGS